MKNVHEKEAEVSENEGIKQSQIELRRKAEIYISQ